MSGRRGIVIVVALLLSVIAAFGVAGHSRLSGPVLFSFTGSHGVHRDDLIVLAAWLAGIACCLRLWRD